MLGPGKEGLTPPPRAPACRRHPSPHPPPAHVRARTPEPGVPERASPSSQRQPVLLGVQHLLGGLFGNPVAPSRERPAAAGNRPLETASGNRPLAEQGRLRLANNRIGSGSLSRGPLANRQRRCPLPEPQPPQSPQPPQPPQPPQRRF
ncbi:TMF-regulated nuclear protein 1-like [Mustela lutreola]|uniref:TMF-regulated nuclear protein 1-like n=1 Tax=Mustela lutreola TaxID=9666 RepID=UPI0027976F72|nr:TMF-regulated nuclear protein 1-like [Mustela lutreola]